MKKYETDEERLAARREANRRYLQSEKGRATTYRHNHGPKALERYAKYRQTEKYAASQERRRVKDQAAGWPVQTAQRRRLREGSPERFAAYSAVTSAVRSGAIVKPEVCVSCKTKRVLHAHHYLGYAPEHWLDVLWLCVPCHRMAHGR